MTIERLDRIEAILLRLAEQQQASDARLEALLAAIAANNANISELSKAVAIQAATAFLGKGAGDV